MGANIWDEQVALNQLLPLLRGGPAQDCVDAWQWQGLTALRDLLPILSYKFCTEGPLARWNTWKKRVQTTRDGSYKAYGLQLQVDGKEAAKGTGLSERAIENEIVERFSHKGTQGSSVQHMTGGARGNRLWRRCLEW